jgi:hypothetical protein
MSTKALFITESVLIENSVINESVSYTQIRPTIIKVQEMRIQPILGSPLYAEIATQVVSGTVTNLNQTLLNEYIQPAIREWLYLELPHVLAYKFMNKNMMRRRSEESDVMDMSEMKAVTDKARNDAEWYSERITRYLLENRNSYPLFNSPPAAIDTIYPKMNNYTAGMVLGRNYGMRLTRRERLDGERGICRDCDY